MNCPVCGEKYVDPEARKPLEPIDESVQRYIQVVDRFEERDATLPPYLHRVRIRMQTRLGLYFDFDVAQCVADRIKDALWLAIESERARP